MLATVGSISIAVLAFGACVKMLLNYVERRLVFKAPQLERQSFDESALSLASRGIQARTTERTMERTTERAVAAAAWSEICRSAHKLRYFVRAKPEHDGIVVFYHGNACLASDMTMFVTNASHANMACALVEYPGYAEQPSSTPIRRSFDVSALLSGFGCRRKPGNLPCKKAVLENALLAFDQVVQDNADLASKRVVVAGESLGSCVATYVASQRQSQVQTLVLVSCFPSIAHVANVAALRFLMQNNFNAAKWAPKVTANTTMIHGTNDAVAPPEMCLLQATHFIAPVKIKWVQQADHNNLTRTSLFWQHFKTAVLEDSLNEAERVV